MKKKITCLLNKINLSKMNRYKHEKLTKILTIALLVLILLSVFSISFMHFTYALTSVGGDPSSSSVTDLTNTTWYVWSGWSASGAYGQFDIDFLIDNAGTYYLFSIGYGATLVPPDYIAKADSIAYGESTVVSGSIISSRSFVLHITGGNHATNIDLISWLETNGTQLKVTDLTDTTWNVPAGWEAESGYGEFNIAYDLTVDNNYYSCNGIRLGYKFDYDDVILKPTANYIYYTGTSLVGEFNNDSSFIASFIGGTNLGNDTSNPKLIAWLSKYGELEASEPEPDPDPDPNIGSFTIYYEDESRYETLSYVIGQTFGEWVDSSYNTLGASIVNGYNKSNGEIDDFISLGENTYFPEVSYGQYYDIIVLPEGGYAHPLTPIVDRAIYEFAPILIYEDVFGAGYSVGYDDGYSRGQIVGEGIGYNNGFDDGYIDGYSKGESDTFVSGFFGNFLSGVVQAIDSIHFYEYVEDDMGTEDTTDDEIFYISPWSIFIVFIGLAFVMIFLKVFRGG